MLKQAAAGGQGISSFIDVSADEVPENFEEYYQDGDDDPTLYGDTTTAEEQHEEQHEGQDDAAGFELTEADYHEYDTSYENTEGGHGAQDEYDRYEETDQAGYDASAEADHPSTTINNAHAANEAHSLQYDQSETDQSQVKVDVANASFDGEADQTTTATEVEAGCGVAGVREDQEEDSKEISAASSTTLHADTANDTAGEYNGEDLIDWDDSTLTSQLSELCTDDDDEFSTFLTAPDSEAIDAGHPSVEAGDSTVPITDAHLQQDADAKASETSPQQNAEAVQDSTASLSADSDVAGGESNEQLDKTVDNELSEGFQASANEESHDPPQENPAGSSGPELGVEEDMVQREVQDDPHANIASHNDASRPSDGEHKAQTGEELAADDVDYIDFGNEDDIDFDDDTYEQHEARKVSQAEIAAPKSPNGKRTFAESDELDASDEPELKKVRSS